MPTPNIYPNCAKYIRKHVPHLQNLLQLSLWHYFNRGTSFATAVDKGSTLALTNINSTCDIWEFVKLCQEAGIKPIAGVEVRNDDHFLYILIAANNKGLAWIHSFLSEHLMDKKPFPEASTFFDNSPMALLFIHCLQNPYLNYCPMKRSASFPGK